MASRVPGARILRTYEEYVHLVQAFYAGSFDLLVIIGRPGIAKSHAFEHQMPACVHMIKGWTAPLAAYQECFEHRNELLVFDDAETLWEKPAGRVLLRTLCELKAIKRLSWHSAAADRAGVPRQFLTSSRVALITNGLGIKDAAERQAILDRAVVVCFEPTPLEIHKQVAQWFWRQDIFDEIGRNLHRIADLSMRSYVKAAQVAESGADWKQYIAEALCDPSPVQVVQALEGDMAYPTVKAKVARFVALTGECRATYFNIKRRLIEGGRLAPPDLGEIADLKVQGLAPVRLTPEMEAAEAQLKDSDGGAAFSTDTPNISPDAPPDDNPRRWLENQLAQALRQGDLARAAKLRELLRRHTEGEQAAEG